MEKRTEAYLLHLRGCKTFWLCCSKCDLDVDKPESEFRRERDLEARTRGGHSDQGAPALPRQSSEQERQSIFHPFLHRYRRTYVIQDSTNDRITLFEQVDKLSICCFREAFENLLSNASPQSFSKTQYCKSNSRTHVYAP